MSGQKKRIPNWVLFALAILCLLILVYVMGPEPAPPDFASVTLPVITSDLKHLEDSINEKEQLIRLKPDNQARIVWATPYQKTPYSMVYLHGNGASQEEGDPIHEALAARYGCNLYLARLEDHGLEGDNLLEHIDPVRWMQSALDAIAIGHALGEKVIVVSCSTGSTLALYLASKYPDLTEAQIMLSPNVDLYDPRSFLISAPWGLQLSRLIIGSKFYDWTASAQAQQYWYTHYRIEGIVTLKTMIDEIMNEETFGQINDPLYLSYYYKDEDHQDNVVSVKRMRDMFAQLGTPAALKKEVALSDAATHIIGSDLFNTHLESVWTPLTAYCENVLHLSPVREDGWQPFLDQRSTN